MSLAHEVYRRIWQLDEPNLKRTKEMKVLCLGLSRSGTNSLREAVSQLGYDHVYHGFDLYGRAGDTVYWSYLQEKFGKGKKITREEFDVVLGDCEAVTDSPCAIMWKDLIDAYPEAKVVNNYRGDVDRWFQSMWDGPMSRGRDWQLYIFSFFNSELFWRFRQEQIRTAVLYNGSFEKYGKITAINHYKDIEAYCKEQGRSCLNWQVQEGWAPLCQYLGKDVPEGEFPRGNTIPALLKRVKDTNKPHYDSAKRNIATLVFSTLALGSLVYYGYQRSPFRFSLQAST